MKKNRKKMDIINGITILAISVLFGFFLITYASDQMKRIHKRLNESAYITVDNTLTNLSNAISNKFTEDHKQIEIIASSCSNVDNIENYLDSLDIPSDIEGIYYSSGNDQEAVGKDGENWI